MISKLTPADEEMFNRFLLPPEILARAGVCRVTDAEAREHYGMRGEGDMAGIIFPYLAPITGYRVTARLRRDHPEIRTDGKLERKYVSPMGDNRHLYFPPGCRELLNDDAVPVVIVESEKAVLAITALAARRGRRLLTIATGGCWGWRGKTGLEPGPNGERAESRGPLPDFSLLTLKGRKVLIAFDSNVVGNPKVRRARHALAETLRGCEAKLYLVDLPRG